MNKLNLLKALKVRTESALADLILPVKPTKEDPDQIYRAPAVYICRLPDGKRTTQFSPYILHTVVNSSDKQDPGDKVPDSLVNVRSVFCVYHADEEEGGIALLETMERVRIDLLRNPILDNTYEIDMQGGVEGLVYPDDTAPFFLGEMMVAWKLPPVKREVRYW